VKFVGKRKRKKRMWEVVEKIDSALRTGHSLVLSFFLDGKAPRFSQLSFGICGCRDEGNETRIFHGRGSGTWSISFWAGIFSGSIPCLFRRQSRVHRHHVCRRLRVGRAKSPPSRASRRDGFHPSDARRPERPEDHRTRRKRSREACGRPRRSSIARSCQTHPQLLVCRPEGPGLQCTLCNRETYLRLDIFHRNYERVL